MLSDPDRLTDTAPKACKANGLQRLRALRNRILPPRQRRVFNLVVGAVSTRYFAEALKDIAGATIAGLVAGLVIARFSDWSPSHEGRVMVITVIGFAIMVLAFGSSLAVLATLREKVLAQEEATMAQDDAELVSWARIVVLGLVGMMLFMSLIYYYL